MVRLIDTYDGIGVQCDCGETTYVYDWSEGDVVDCSSDNCCREFSFNVDVNGNVEDDSGVDEFGDMTA